MSDHYTVSDYLCDRLAELDVEHVFGVPGDYTLSFLDHIVGHPRLSWIGCTNELNAGYAADGYARLRGIGVLNTTFGVGELSAINAVTGSFAEFVPVVHIVGSPSTASQAAHRVVHHSLGDGTFTHFLEMHAPITCARAALTGANAPAEIDRVLSAVRSRRQPGYLLLPADVAEQPAEPPRHPLPAMPSPTDSDALTGFAAAAERLLSTASSADGIRVLAGILVHRLGATGELAKLLDTATLPHASTLWAKSVVDETAPAFAGIYSGAVSEQIPRAVVEDAEVLVVAGVQFTDLNSGFFTQRLPRERTIEIAAESVSVGVATYGPIAMVDALATLAELVSRRTAAFEQPNTADTSTAALDDVAPEARAGAGALHQDSLWSTVAAALRPGDVVVADQGTAFYGIARHRLPTDVTFIGQPLWASIGYTLPATLGAGLAASGRRCLLLIGDGAAQMTATELSSLVRHRIPVVVLIVDNDGYTIERAIHGPDEIYNDIARWEWTQLPAAFGAVSAATHDVTEVSDLADALAGTTGGGFTLIQARVPRDEIPELLDGLAAAAAAVSTPKR
jgi:indolepyruvate decarboxylase